ncbi:hypothetical protein R1sor_021729 [Riccia sorocarpa]|uniref:Uncharacterized protein n=1 Tax=Riccia sorocarpa TaxID=122646 RepID=A0ABD3GIL3_9MARC
MKQYGRDLGLEWREIVDIFRREYGEVLNLDATPWHVNAWNEKDINPFVEKLCTHVSKLLSKKTPQAPSACCKLISEILDPKHPNSSQMLAKPVWNIQDFYAYISKRLEALHIGSFDQSLIPQRVLNAMIRYMHDVGSIFYLSECQLVVGDINWLTHKFLGVLISEGHGFHSKLLPGEFSSRDGTVTKGTLETILKELSEIRWRKKVTVDPQVLEDLLVNLDLCYPVGDVGGVQGYFMPTIVGRKNARVQDLTRWGTAPSSSETDWQYFGYRLLCADTKTSLTSVTFPRFQIRFRKDMEANGETCILQRDVIRLDRKGYSIIVENAEEETHIDVLFQFSKRTSRDEATLYVRERILQEFRKFCTSPEGCRGVTLETAIIRPECVQRLTPQKYLRESIRRATGWNDFVDVNTIHAFLDNKKHVTWEDAIVEEKRRRDEAELDTGPSDTAGPRVTRRRG